MHIGQFPLEIQNTVSELWFMQIKHSDYADVFLIWGREPKWAYKRSNLWKGSLIFRELAVYREYRGDFIPEPKWLCEEWVLMNYEPDNGERIPLLKMAESLAKFHNWLNTLTFIDSFEFDFFGDIETYLSNIIKTISSQFFQETEVEWLKKDVIPSILNIFLSESSNHVHGNVCRNNIRYADNEIRFIDFETISRSPLEFDIAFLLSQRVEQLENEPLETIIDTYRSNLNFPYELDYGKLRASAYFDYLRRFAFYLNKWESHHAKNMLILLNRFRASA